MTPRDVESASEWDGKLYELMDGVLMEKKVGFWEHFIAGQIVGLLNKHFYPHEGAAASEVMIYCFKQPSHGRKPDVVFLRNNRFPNNRIPDGGIRIAPTLVVEVLSPTNSGIEVEDKLEEYLDARIPLVWIVNPERRTIRVYRTDGTTRLFRGHDVIEMEPLLPGFRLVLADVFPVVTPSA